MKFYAIIMGGKAQWEEGAESLMRQHLISLEGKIVCFDIHDTNNGKEMFRDESQKEKDDVKQAQGTMGSGSSNTAKKNESAQGRR